MTEKSALSSNSDKQRNWSGVHEHILVYANAGFQFIGPDAGPGKFRVRPSLGDVPVRLDPITTPKTLVNRANTYYPIYNEKTGLWYPCAPNQVWRFWSEKQPPRGRPREVSMEALIRNGEIFFPEESEPPFWYETRAQLDAAIEAGNVPRDGKNRPLLRADLPDLDFWVRKPIARSRLSRIVKQTPEHEEAKKPVGSWIAGIREAVDEEDAQTLRSDRQGVATTEIEHLFGAKVFEFPKPLSLVKALLRTAAGDGDIVMDFFAGSGTTGHATLALNADDEGDRRFILVSSTEATAGSPDKNLCRDVCAQRLRKAIAGGGSSASLSGDFAYLRARRIDWDDVVYELDHAAVWFLIQLRYDRPLAAFKEGATVQISRPGTDQADDPVVVYVPQVADAAVREIQRLAATSAVATYCPTPGPLRDQLELPSVTIDQTPDRLLAEFPRIVAGL